MKILFLGDSITEGAGASAPDKQYVTLVGEMLGCKARNYGISGTRIARQIRPSYNTRFDLYFGLRAQVMDKEADLVFVFGGTNDYGHGDAPMGDDDSRDVRTFCGALNLLTEYLIDNYGREKLCFILPLPRYCDDRAGGDVPSANPNSPYTLAQYREKMKTLLTAQGIAIMDLYDQIPRPTTNTGDEFFKDGLHPNDAGHHYLAEKITEWVKERY